MLVADILIVGGVIAIVCGIIVAVRTKRADKDNSD